MSLLEKFKNYCEKNKLIQDEDKILLGVSGGPDSLAMLDFFVRIRAEFSLQLYVFHLNHMFREEANKEAEFVRRVCEKQGLEFFVKKINVPVLIKNKGLSPEEAAREARFKFMEETADKLDIQKIALAHNRNDQVETVLLHVFRGSALKGLTGIQPLTNYKKKLLIHPLLAINRYEIEDYCKKRGLNPCHDESNEETVYVRNKLRHRVIPYIEKEINPGLKNVIIRMANILREEEDFLSELTANKMCNAVIEQGNDYIILSLEYMRELPTVLRRRVLQRVIYKLCDETADLYYSHLQNLDDFIREAETGKEMSLPHGVRMKRIYDKLIIKKGEFVKTNYNYKFRIEVPDEINLPGRQKIRAEFINLNSDWQQKAACENICLCDYGQIKEPLIVRTRKPGDKFQPLGMQGRKKIKDFFIDEKITPEKRDKIPLIVDAEGRIIWISGMRMNEKFKVTTSTDNVICFTYIKENS